MDDPICYMKRTADYYLGLGYNNPYIWAHFDEVPFARPQKPLHEMCIGIVTTAAPYQPGKGDQGPGAAYNAAAKFHRVYRLPITPEPDLRIAHIAIDRTHTSAADRNSYLPLAGLIQAAAHGQIGAAAPFIYGFPTNRSQRTNRVQDCPALVQHLLDDDVDGVILVPNCPVCHQSIALAARAAEQAGLPTVIMGCARDIIEHAGVPRLYFSDFPLGNSCGRPHDPSSQAQMLAGALDLLISATQPRSTVINPLRWNGTPGWKRDYANIEKLSADDIARRRADFDAAKAVLRQKQP